jgi:hypothetical protein
MYTGQSFLINCGQGGLDANYNIDAIQPFSFVHPSRNIILNEGGRRKRGGTDHVNSSAVSGTPQITGIFDFTQESGTQHVVFGTDGGKVYQDATTTIVTGGTASKYYNFEYGDDMLFICNGADIPLTWNGAAATASNMADIPSSWTGSNYPKQFIMHGFGASQCMWALGFVDGNVYASKDGDLDDFKDASVLAIQVYTGDGYGIVGGVEYGDRLIVFGKKQAYIIDDTDADRAKWGYQATQWSGGAAHHRVIVKTPNDVVAMADDGTIYSVVAAENYGDYKAASLTRPAHIDTWIKENVSLAYIDKFHSCYDPVLRCIYFFVVRSGKTTVDTALVYFVDRDPAEAWTIHDNQSYDSGFSAVSSALIQVSTGTYKVYTGDYSGFKWKLNATDRSDEASGYYAGFKTPQLAFENPRTTKLFHQGRVIFLPKGSYNLAVRIWVDGVPQTGTTVSLAGLGSVLGSFLLGTDTLGGTELLDTPFNLGVIGKRIQFEFYNSTADQDFFISQVVIDFKSMGPKAD